MKRLLLFLPLLCNGIAWGQDHKTTNSTALVKVIPARDFKGSDFTISIDVKKITADPDGAVKVSTLQVGKSDWDFISNSGAVAKAPDDAEWHQLTLTGQVKAAAEKIWLYMTTNGNGDFFFDNIQLRIKNGHGAWQDIQVANGDFEQSSLSKPLKGLENTRSAKKIQGNRFAIQTEESSLHKQVLHIHTEGGVKDTNILYGYNREAGRYISSNGANIYYEIYGKGEPLLLLHGNGGSISSFARIIPALAKQYKVIAVDTRAQGKSTDNGRQRFTYELFAEDMKNLLDTLGFKQVNIVGWSDGGITGLLLASRHPQYVRKLVTMGANLNPSDTSISAAVLAKTKKDIKKLERENNTKDSTTLKLMRLMLEEPHITPASLQTIEAGTLVMAGEKDVVLEKHTRLIAASIPRAIVRILKGETHWVVTENPTLFEKEILNFLSKQGSL